MMEARTRANRARAVRGLGLFALLTILLPAAVGWSSFAQITATSGPVVYRLDKGNLYEQGCFGPCACPVLFNEAVKGTFVLTPTGFDGLYNTYAVTDVNWMVTLGGTDTFVVGSGTYKVGGEFALQQELALDLQVGDNAVQHFDSGLVTVPAPFPSIQASISINGMTCFDTVFRVSASPVPVGEIVPYGLLDGSTFQRGCFGTCDCAIGEMLPVGGTFGLVPLPSADPWKDYAVVSVRWRVRSKGTAVSRTDLPVRGGGFYRVGGDFALQQRLELRLLIDKEAPARFDSGLVPGGGRFPRIDALVSMNNMTCFDTVFDLHAAPRRTVSVKPAIGGNGDIY